jgi:hypothetical protein
MLKVPKQSGKSDLSNHERGVPFSLRLCSGRTEFIPFVMSLNPFVVSPSTSPGQACRTTKVGASR